MNQKQKLTLWIGIAVVALIGLFPPWNSVQTIATAGGAIRSTRSAGYAFLFTPPVAPEPHVKHNFPLDVLDVEIDTTRLIIELVFSLVVIVGLVLVLKRTAAQTMRPRQGTKLTNLAQDVHAD